MAYTVTTETASFVVDANDNLLEALERSGHDIEYQCRAGYCGSCRTRKISGQVIYDDLPLAFIARDEVLPCCCRAASDLRLECSGAGLDAEQNVSLIGAGERV